MKRYKVYKVVGRASFCLGTCTQAEIDSGMYMAFDGENFEYEFKEITND